MSSTQGIIIIIPTVLILNASQSHAFDPFTAMAGAEAMNGIMSNGSADDLLDVGDAAVDLMNESEVDEDLVKEADSNVKRLEDVNRQIRDAKYLNNEMRDFTQFDLSRTKSLASKLRNISSKIRQGKRFYSLLSGGKGKQNNSALQIEQIKLNYRILDELRNMRLTEFNKYLEDKERQVKFQVTLEQALEEERKYQKIKLTEFKTKRKSL